MRRQACDGHNAFSRWRRLSKIALPLLLPWCLMGHARAGERQPYLQQHHETVQPYLIPDADIPHSPENLSQSLPPPPSRHTRTQRIESSLDAHIAAWGRLHAWSRIVAVARARPRAFRAAYPQRYWWLARAQAALGQPAQAQRSYAELLQPTLGPAIRLITLRMAIKRLPPAYAQSLVAGVLTRPLPEEERRRVEALAYPWWLSLIARQHARGDEAGAARWLETARPYIIERRNVDAARLAAAINQTLGKPVQEYAWLRRAVDWSGQPTDARRLASALIGTGQWRAARTAMMHIPKSDPEYSRLRARVDLGQARAAYARADYVATLQYFNQGAKLAPLARGDHLLAAWSQYHLGRDAQAASAFTALYKAHPDMASARGLVLSDHRRDALAHSYRVARVRGGPLAELLPMAYIARARLEGKSFSAIRLSPRNDGRLAPLAGGSTAPFNPDLRKATPSSAGWQWFGGSIGWRDRRGEGASRLREAFLPQLEGRRYLGDGQTFGLFLWRRRLQADALRPGDLPILTPTAHATHLTRHSVGQGFAFRYSASARGPSDSNIEAELGRTPSGGVVTATWMGSLALSYSEQASGWRLAVVRQPVRDSLLSESGTAMHLTVNGNKYTVPFNWGRVMRNALIGSGYHAMGEDWKLSGEVQLALLRGHNVENNQSIQAYAALLHPLHADWVDTLRIGPSALFMHDTRNQDHFTPGNGGYFSPDYLVMPGGVVEAEWERANHWSLHLHAGVGYQWQKEMAAPAIPLPGLQAQMNTALGPHALTFGDYAASRSQGPGEEFELAGACWLGNKGWKAGGWLRLRTSPAYRDLAGMLYLRYNFGGARGIPTVPGTALDRALY